MIKECIQLYAEAAKNAIEAGVDYLIGHFIQDVSNHEYCGWEYRKKVSIERKALVTCNLSKGSEKKGNNILSTPPFHSLSRAFISGVVEGEGDNSCCIAACSAAAS